MRPDFIIWDCDGVLIDSEIISAQMLIEALAGFGVTIDRAFVVRHFLGRSYPVVLAEVRLRFGVDLPESFEGEYRARLLSAFEARLEVMPGAFDALRDCGVPWCVATSSSRPRAVRSLEITGLAPLVGGRLFTASEVTRGKPAPDLFLRAAEALGAADPARVLVIEDSLNGIRAARAAGMACWRFTGGSHLRDQPLDEPDDALPDRRIASFAELRQFIPDVFANTEKDGTGPC